MKGIDERETGAYIEGTRISVNKVVELIELVDSERADQILHDDWELSSEEIARALRYHIKKNSESSSPTNS
jgi:uncharacterized protein (DUF433 family)